MLTWHISHPGMLYNRFIVLYLLLFYSIRLQYGTLYNVVLNLNILCPTVCRSLNRINSSVVVIYNMLRILLSFDIHYYTTLYITSYAGVFKAYIVII